MEQENYYSTELIQEKMETEPNEIQVKNGENNVVFYSNQEMKNGIKEYQEMMDDHPKTEHGILKGNTSKRKGELLDGFNDIKNHHSSEKIQEETPTLQKPSINPYDEMPIGGGGGAKKFEISEYPSNDYNPKNNKAKITKAPAKKGMTQNKFSSYNEPKENDSMPKNNPYDDMPIKSGPKFNINEYLDDNLSKNNQMEEEKLKTFNSFDDVPINTGKKFNFSEYPEGYDPNAEMPGAANNAIKDEETGPLATRVKSKVWKTRNSAFEELVKRFEESLSSDQIFYEFAGDFLKFIADSHPGAQEKALQAFKIYIEKINGLGAIDNKECIKVLIDKGITTTKPNIKKLALDILCMIFEKSEKTGCFEGLIESINSKNQKTACAGIQSILELLAGYHAKKLDYLKPFFPHVEKLAGSTVLSLRTESMNFYKQAMIYMGEAVKPFLNKLKKAQIDEIEKFYEESPKEIPKPTRSNEDYSCNLANKEGIKGGIAIDAYDISDPVDIFNKFNDPWAEKVLAQAKWNEKKAMLDDLLNAASVPKIANTPFYPITAMLKRLLNDSNVVVMTQAIKIYGALAKGLRKNFTQTCKNIVSTLLSKFKEKKTQVIDETHKTLEQFFYCINLEDIIEDLKEALNDKTASAKVNTLLWIDKYFERSIKNPEKINPFFKNILPCLKKLLDDSLSEVREAAMVTLGKIKGTYGDEFVGNLYNDINQAKLQKINESANSVSSKTCPKQITLNTMEEEKITSRPGTGIATGAKTPLNNSINDLKVLRPQASNSNLLKTPTNSKKTGSSKNLNGLDNNNEGMDITSTLTAEEAELKLIELGLNDSTIKELNENDWKRKKPAINELSLWIEDNSKLLANYTEHIVRMIRSKLKDWKESNMNIIKEALQLLLMISKNKDLILTKKTFCIISNFIMNNIGDAKYSELCITIVLSFLEGVSPKFIIMNYISTLQDSKNTKSSNPKTLIESCNLLTKILDVVTIKYFPLEQSIEFAKLMLNNSNPSVRTAGINLLKDFYKQLGKPLNDFLNDINPNILKTLQTEFQLIIPNTNNNLNNLCKIQFRGEAESEISAETISSNPLDSLPRIDISKDAEKLLKKLSDSDWKVRKEGIDALDQLITSANNRITSNGLHDVVAALKARLNDPNKSLVKIVITFVGKFATALGNNSKIYSKTLLPTLINNLSDKQSQVRQETNIALDKFAIEIGNESILNIALPLLSQESPEMRTEVINLILRKSDALKKADIKNNIVPILTCLQDKTKSIRDLAEKLLEKCIQCIGISPFVGELKDLKPAIQQQLKPVIEKYKGSEIKISNEEMDIEQSVGGGVDSSRLLKKGSIVENRSNSNLRGAQRSNSVNQIPPMPNVPTTTQFNQNQTQPQLNNSRSIKLESPKRERDLGIKAPAPVLKNSNSILNNSSNLSSGNLSTDLIQITNQKEKRQEEERKAKWPLDELNDEMVEKLKDNLKRSLVPEVSIKLFSVDSKKNIEGINLLKKALSNELNGTIDILDLIFRWIFMRLWDNSNPLILREIIEYIYSLINLLEGIKYKLFEFEAYVLIPCLVEKLGNIMDDQKDIINKIFDKICLIYPPNKVINGIINGLNNINIKTRIESLEMIAHLVEIFGSEVLHQQHIKFLIRLLVNPDINIVNSTLRVLSELYKHIGESISMISNELGPREMEAIRQRAKMVNKIIIKPNNNNNNDMIIETNNYYNPPNIQTQLKPQNPISIPQNKLISSNSSSTNNIQSIGPTSQFNSNNNTNNIPIHNIQPTQKTQLPQQVSSLASQIPVELQRPVELPRPIDEFQRTNLHQQQTEEPSTIIANNNVLESTPIPNVVINSTNSNSSSASSNKINEELFERSLTLLINGSISSKLDALLLIHDIAVSEDADSKKFLISKANSLAQTLHIVFKNIYDKPKPDVPAKFVQYFLNMCHKLCNVKHFLKNVNEQSLIGFTEEMLNRLIIEEENKNNENKDQSETVIKTLNSSMLRILENSNSNIMFAVLFDLLIKYRKIHTYAKILGLIVKCILKLTKALEQLISYIDPSILLLKSHLYLSEFNSVAQHSDDIGIKTIKTILNELVKILGDKIWDSYRIIQTDSTPDNYIQRWITVILKPNSQLLSPKYGNSSQSVITENDKMQEKSQVKQTNNNQIIQQQHQQQHQQQQQQQHQQQQQTQNLNDNEKPEIRQVIDNLKRRENFENGIRVLHELLQKYPDHNLSMYLKDCSSKFVDYVNAALERLNYQKNHGGIPALNANNSIGGNASTNTVLIAYSNNTNTNANPNTNTNTNANSNNNGNSISNNNVQNSAILTNNIKPSNIQDARLAMKTVNINPNNNIPSLRLNKASPYPIQNQENNNCLQLQSIPQHQTIPSNVNITLGIENSKLGGLDEFHNKVNNLKSRYGMLLKNNEHNDSQALKDNKNLENNINILNQSNSTHSHLQQQQQQIESNFNSQQNLQGIVKQNSQDPNNTAILPLSSSSAINTTTGSTSIVGSNKSTENILQKLSEMKLKMQSIVSKGNLTQQNQ